MSPPSLLPTRKAPFATRAGASWKGRHRASVASLLLAALGLLALIACGETGAHHPAHEPAPQAIAGPVDLSETARQGETIFNANCAQCHGAAAVGTDQGPTLIDRVYHPGHHADAAFRLAVLRGVRQHHWQFGNMLPVPGLAPAEVDKIICYVRELQLANNIFKPTEYQPIC